LHLCFLSGLHWEIGGLAGRQVHGGVMGRKQELKDVDWIARGAGFTREQELLFREYLHDCKAKGDRGTKNTRGDFTRDEMKAKAVEFKEMLK
jgi:hypothetical protein